jgi:hypothetical protein
MRWKTMIIAGSVVAALAFGIGTKGTPQRPILHALIAPVMGGR